MWVILGHSAVVTKKSGQPVPRLERGTLSCYARPLVAELVACSNYRAKMLAMAGGAYVTSPLMMSVVIGVVVFFPLRTWTVFHTCPCVVVRFTVDVNSLKEPLLALDDFPCLSPCLFIGHEIRLTGLLAEIPVSPITLTKCLLAIRCPPWNSMLCFQNICLSGV